MACNRLGKILREKRTCDDSETALCHTIMRNPLVRIHSEEPLFEKQFKKDYCREDQR